jgi:NAD-dependent dihydropyrimidine dehydrogenase PreA subunit
MKNSIRTIKILVFSIVFLLFGTGRWVNLAMFHHWPGETAALIAVIYGTLIALLSYFITDLVLANGFLQFKLLSIKIILFGILAVTLLNAFLFPHYLTHINKITIIEISTAFLLLVVILRLDMKKDKKEFIFFDENILPPKYLRCHPVKTFLETLFRLFPYPAPIALYKIGKPSQTSPVLVTGNYDLTVRRVISSLHSQNIDCWLLAYNSRGINIWCSSLANHSRTDDIIKAIKLTHLSEKIDHNKIILPQLCAANISTGQIKKETGVISQFGPLSIGNISRYLQDPKDQDIRKATFNLKERLEMAVGCPLILCALLTVIYNFIGLTHLLVIIPIIYALTILQAIIFPFRIIKSIVRWSLFIGSIVFVVNYFLFPGFILLGNNIAISMGIAYAVNEFTGWSPLLKYSLIPYKKAQIAIDHDLCIGCYRCIEVCPKSVYGFEKNKSNVINLNACVLCKSCFRQCPTGAINHS